MREKINSDRRRFLGAATMTMTAARLAALSAANAPPANPRTRARDAGLPRLTTSFGPLKQIDAGVLNIGYADVGPAGGRPVLLLHGWPYDIHSYVDVAPALASAGYRAVVPYLRGFGTTRFLSSETFRNGQPSAQAVDAVALMDALGIDRAVVAGFDWGARTADIMATLWPGRCKGLVSVSGYLIGSQERRPLTDETAALPTAGHRAIA